MKDKCHLSSFSALTVIPIFLLVKFLILRYDDSTVQCEGEIDFSFRFAASPTRNIDTGALRWFYQNVFQM